MSPLSYPEPLVSVREDWKKDAHVYFFGKRKISEFFVLFCFGGGGGSLDWGV